MADTILIIDFGSQVTQLIARRLRETGVYTEIQPCTTAPDNIAAAAPNGIILSGGPNSVALADTPRAPQIVFDLGDDMGASSCVGCGECVQACPTGALMPAGEVGLN